MVGMLVPLAQNTKQGRPPISDELWNLAVDLINEGLSVHEIVARTGLRKTKIYEIRRTPIKREPAPLPSDYDYASADGADEVQP